MRALTGSSPAAAAMAAAVPTARTAVEAWMEAKRGVEDEPGGPTAPAPPRARRAPRAAAWAWPSGVSGDALDRPPMNLRERGERGQEGVGRRVGRAACALSLSSSFVHSLVQRQVHLALGVPDEQDAA